MERLRHLKKLNYANLMATLGVMSALGGTSYAAVKIDGSNVRDNSLTGRDVKNGSLTGTDIKDRSIGPRDLEKKLAGKRGPRGVTGPPGNHGTAGSIGPQGPAGQRGPSLGTFVSGSGVDTVAGGFQSVESLTLGAGNWILLSSGFVRNDAQTATKGTCILEAETEEPGGEPTVREIATTGEMPLQAAASAITQRSEQFSLNAARAFTGPTQVRLKCGSFGEVMRVRSTIITAIQTAEITDQNPASD